MKSQRGASLVEYSLMLGLIAMIALVSVRQVGQTVSCTLNDIGTKVSYAGRTGMPLIPSCVSKSEEAVEDK